MNRKHLNKLFHRGNATKSLMRPLKVVMMFPQPEVITALFGRLELHGMKQVFIIGTEGTFNDAIFPRLTFGNQRMNKTPVLQEFVQWSLSGFFPLGIFHGEVPGIVRPDQKKGGI